MRPIPVYGGFALIFASDINDWKVIMHLSHTPEDWPCSVQD